MIYLISRRGETYSDANFLVSQLESRVLTALEHDKTISNIPVRFLRIDQEQRNNDGWCEKVPKKDYYVNHCKIITQLYSIQLCP